MHRNIRIHKTTQDRCNEELVGRAASYLFEAFAAYWMRILFDRRELLGIQFWQEILSVTKTWEDMSGTTIHKGTPYFFLAENYLLTGDRDTGFVFLYNAISEDTTLADFAPFLNYPDESPAYLTATMRRGDNQMDNLVNQWREKLNKYIQKFNVYFNRSFGLTQFDSKFLGNKQLSNVVYFFVFNFICLYEITTHIELRLLQNEFSRLKILDLIFNLCLVIDETLKTFSGSDTIRHGIMWLCSSKDWMNQNDLKNFWDNLHVARDEPNNMIPRLLSMTDQYNGNPVKNEVFTLSIVYNLRNYGGHNVRQQEVLTRRFDKIIEHLLMSLFLCVDT